MTRRSEEDVAGGSPGPFVRNEPPSRDRSRLAVGWYHLVRWAALLSGALAGGFRMSGRENVPASGGALIVANHQSFLDVFALGMAVPRPLRFVARSSLFVPVIGFLIRSLGGFPIDREGGGMGGLKETLRRLKAGSLVVIFPEGTRSEDGRMGPLKPGFAAMVRARVPIVPVGIAGTFEAWPPGRRFPRPHPIHVHIGTPLRPEELEGLDADSLVALVEARMREVRDQAWSQLSQRQLRPDARDHDPARANREDQPAGG